MTAPIGTDLALAVRLLRAGKLVAFATETVYGLGADALNPLAVARVFEAKRRPKFDPLIVHLSDADELDRYAARIPPDAVRLAQAFWPGPLTLVLPKRDIVPDLVTAGLDSVALRVPAHPQARALIAAADTPLAAPSANRFGSISPTTAAHVAEQLGDRIDYILDGGPCDVGIESTIVGVLHDRPEILRLGGLSVEQIRDVVGEVSIRPASSDPGGRSENATPQLAPGMLERHYAPRTPLVVIERLTADLLEPGDALLLPTPPPIETGSHCVEVLSPTGDLRECAANFFAALRRLDALHPARILAVRFADESLGRALNDRLRRASAR